MSTTLPQCNFPEFLKDSAKTLYAGGIDIVCQELPEQCIVAYILSCPFYQVPNRKGMIECMPQCTIREVLGTLCLCHQHIKSWLSLSGILENCIVVMLLTYKKSYLKYKTFIEDGIQRFSVYFCFKFFLFIWQHKYFDIRI